MPALRPYSRNSAHAAARIVAIALVADGRVGRDELDVLQRRGAHTALGLAPDDLKRVTQALCDDLLAAARARGSHTCRIDGPMLAAVMAEVDDPALRLRVVQLCAAVVEADGRVTEGESLVVGAALEHWGPELLDRLRKVVPA